ncbi:SAM-dependent methyltransferase [Paracoccus hibiscisoli]|uniref:SAM-dependent methyltransferase n=1 Tax=Paracoccus hibiscisoli TaxID=2023261 RepID=UPI00145CA669|nr:SAM-dependent methyltransferase [Paracoccus hibiscisoli]
MPSNDILDHLSRLYALSDDPWNHRSSPYEALKYQATLAAIGLGPFHHALEVGCGNGTFATLLADRCETLTVMDCIPAAVALAKQALTPCPHARVIQGTAPRNLPQIRPDLVVLSEVLYFLTPADIVDLGVWLRHHATGAVVAVNWTGPTDEPLTGTEAVGLLGDVLGGGQTHHCKGYRIDLF